MAGAIVIWSCSTQASPHSSPGSTCRLGTPAVVSGSGRTIDGQTRGLTADGRALLVRRPTPAGPSELWIESEPGAEATLIRTTDPGVQVLYPTGTSDAVIWREERAADLYRQDWTVWAYDRASREVRTIGTRPTGLGGDILPSVEVRPSIAGSSVAWSATASASDGGQPQTAAWISTIDGAASVVAHEAYWVSAVGDHQIEYLSPQPDGGDGPSLQLVAFDAKLKTTKIVSTLTGTSGAIHAASASMSVISIENERTIIRERRTGRETTFKEGAAWPVAGDHEAAWIGDSGSRLILEGGSTPTTLGSVPQFDDVFVAGPWVGWVSASTDAGPVISRAVVSCG